MAEDVSKSVKFIAKLLQLTQEGRLKWKSGQGGDFHTVLEDKILKIYKIRRQVANNTGDSITRSWLTSPTYRTIMVLELINADETTAFKFENTAGLKDLMQSVVFSASNVDEYIDKVLEK